MGYRPQEILIEKEVLHTNYVKKILAKFPKIKPQVITNHDWKKRFVTNKTSLTKGKKILYLKNFLGVPVKPCPGFSIDAVCCNYYVLDFIENCPLECSYCILQAIHNQPTIVVHANVEEILQKIGLVCSKRPNSNFAIGTGEHSDSLAMDDILELNPILVEFFAQLPNAKLELKTKTDKIAPLLGLKHSGNTIVSWSLNTEYISKKQEHKTASAKQRVLAAKEISKDGYKIAFHFDPMIYYEGWQAGYSEMIDFIREQIPQKAIAWISIGTLRYVLSLKKIAEERFAKLDLFCGEFALAADGKMKYIRPLREMLCSYMSKELEQKLPQVTKYLCMEQKNVWQNAMEHVPSSAQNMEKAIRSKVFLG